MTTGNLGFAMSASAYFIDMSNIVFPNMSLTMLADHFDAHKELEMTILERDATILAIVKSSDLILEQVEYSSHLVNTILNDRHGMISTGQINKKRFKLANLLALIDNEVEVAAKQPKKSMVSKDGK